MEGESWWVCVGVGVCVSVRECMVCLECFINHFFQSALVAITSVVIYQTLPALDTCTVRLGSCLMTTCNAVNFKSNVIALFITLPYLPTCTHIRYSSLSWTAAFLNNIPYTYPPI